MTAKGLGTFEGKAHILPLRIYYEDTDLSGLVSHANYLRYMERGRTEFFRLAGVTRMADLESAEPSAWAIRNVELAFHRPARVDDALTVHTILTAISGARPCRPPADICQSTRFYRWADRSLHHHVNGQAAAHSRTDSGFVDAFPL